MGCAAMSGATFAACRDQAIVRRLSQALLAPRRVTCGVQLGERRASFWLESYRPLARFWIRRGRITPAVPGHADDECEQTLSYNKSPTGQAKTPGGGGLCGAHQ